MKKNRLHLCILACALSICMLSGTVFAQEPSAEAARRYQPSETLVGLIDEIEELERATRAYYRTADTFEYVSRFIRTGRYHDVRWQLLVGAIDPAYEKAMLAFSDLRKINDFAALTDSAGQAYVLDLAHLAAVADSGRDFAGWAGDLITLASEIDSLYEAQGMIANERSTCDPADLHSNIDALNLRVIAAQNGGSLAHAMRTYYLEGGVERAVTSFLLRETGLSAAELSIDAIEASFAVRLNSATCGRETLALANAYGVADSDRLQYANRAFATWLFQTYCGESVGHEKSAAFRVAPTCLREGALYLVCRHCGKYEEQTLAVSRAHRFDETRTEPTESDPGVVCRTCVRCGLFEESYFDDAEAGDLDCDGCLSMLDYMKLKRGILGDLALTRRQEQLADLNGDGVLDQKDYMLCRAKLLRGRNSEKD